jgi:hypothetical protein
MFSEDPKAFPPHEEVLTPHTTMVIEAESPNAFTPEHCFPGTTGESPDGMRPKLTVPVFMNEGAGPEWSGLSGYYGFVVENVMGAYAALASVFPGNPIQTDRGIIAWNRSWRDDWVNRDVAAALWGENIIGPDYFAHLGSEEEKWMYFERSESIHTYTARRMLMLVVVIVDRWAAHRSSPLVDLWNKMGVNVFTAPHSANFWDAARSSVIEFMNARAPRRRSSHNIVYLDRQHTRRRLSTRDHDAVVHTLASVAQQKAAAFRHLVTGNMTVSEQIREISQATVSGDVVVLGRGGERLTGTDPRRRSWRGIHERRMGAA